MRDASAATLVTIRAVYIDARDDHEAGGDDPGDEGEPTLAWPPLRDLDGVTANPSITVVLSGPLRTDFNGPQPPDGLATVDLAHHAIVRLQPDAGGPDVALSAFYVRGSGASLPRLSIFPHRSLTPGSCYRVTVTGLAGEDGRPVPELSLSFRTTSSGTRP